MVPEGTPSFVVKCVKLVPSYRVRTEGPSPNQTAPSRATDSPPVSIESKPSLRVKRVIFVPSKRTSPVPTLVSHKLPFGATARCELETPHGELQTLVKMVSVFASYRITSSRLRTHRAPSGVLRNSHRKPFGERPLTAVTRAGLAESAGM